MARPSPKEILSDFRTRSLLEATRRLIATRGFDFVTMERVARAAGMTKGGIYLYFRNKEELILAAIEEIAAEMLDEIESQVDPAMPPRERLCSAVRSQMVIMERHQDLLRTLLLDRRILRNSPRGKASRLLSKFRQRHEALLKSILEDGMKQRVFPQCDTANAAFYINRMTLGAAERRMLGLTRAGLEQDTERLLEFLALLFRGRKPNA